MTNQETVSRALIALRENYPDGASSSDLAEHASEYGVNHATLRRKMDIPFIAGKRGGPKGMRGDKTLSIAQEITRRWPCMEIPRGAQAELAEKYRVTRQRIQQIAKKVGVTGIQKVPPPVRMCSSCGAEPAEYRRQYCATCANVPVTCEQCGKGFTITRADLLSRLRDRRVPQFFCSKVCYGKWWGKRAPKAAVYIERDAKMKAWLDEHHSSEMIPNRLAKEFGMNHHTAKKALERYRAGTL